MNRNAIIAIVVALVVAGGYYQFSYVPAQQAAIAQKAADEAAAATKLAEEKAAADLKAAEDAAAAAAAEAAAAATTAATDTTAAATTAATDAAAVLDPANFDAAKVTAMIDASSLDAATKATLNGLVAAAGTDATKIGEALTAVKTALGL